MPGARERLEEAERRLFARYGLAVEPRFLELRDPPVRVRVCEAGSGPPVVLVHGSGSLASAWAPLLPFLEGRRSLAVDLPGFGLSDPHDYRGRSLRAHAVAQLGSLLDALELSRAPIVGTSLGGMWGLCFALDAPERAAAVVAVGVPALALEGMRLNGPMAMMTIPLLNRLLLALPSPSVAMTRRMFARGAGKQAVERAAPEFWEIHHWSMRLPGYATAMATHIPLGGRLGRPRRENFLTDDELRRLAVPVLFLWGDRDVFGAPGIGERAVGLMPDARIEVVSGGHVPWLDEPERCGRAVASFLAERGA